MSRRVRLALNVAVLLVGLLAVAWPFTLGAHPVITCRGAVMHPGEVCGHTSVTGGDDGKTQSYEDRVKAANDAKPVIVGTGVLVAGFGAALLLLDPRRVTTS